MSRILLFLATNIAVITVLSVVMNLMGLNQPGSSMLPTIVIASVFGMGGSLISLLLSKRMALKSSGARVIES
ncbi:MAG: heat shock protein HtpX, partial [Gammaproteobacteria bacterium]